MRDRTATASAGRAQKCARRRTTTGLASVCSVGFSCCCGGPLGPCSLGTSIEARTGLKSESPGMCGSW